MIKKRLASRSAYVLFLGLVLAAADYAAYRLRFAAALEAGAGLPPVQRVDGIPEQTMLRLGWVHADKASSFTRFPREKRPGTIRIGCFGDSFTYGDEVGPAEDYPSVLQELFRRSGFGRVEVLNFGSGAYGLQQSFILWDEVGRRYGLDYVLLGPRAFFPERDCSFDPWYPRFPWMIHARYILKGEGLELVNPLGSSPLEMTRAYFAYFTPLRYLRYDRRAPPFLAALVPPGRRLPNPFYYARDDDEAETLHLLRMFLSRMADSGSRVVVGHYDPPVVRAASSLGRPDVHAALLRSVPRYPYRTPKGHNSAAANRVLAEQFFALLTGRAGLRTRVVEIFGRGAQRDEKDPAPAGLQPDLGRFDICLAGDKAAERACQPVDLSQALGGPAPGLLFVRSSQETTLESPLLPLVGPLTDGAPISMAKAGETVGSARQVGKVRLLRPGFPLGELAVGGLLETIPEEDTREVSKDGWILFIGREPFAHAWRRGPKDGPMAWMPLGRPWFDLGLPQAFLERRAAGERGDVLLVFRGPGSAEVRVPAGRWRARDLRAEFGLPAGFPPVRR